MTDAEHILRAWELADAALRELMEVPSVSPRQRATKACVGLWKVREHLNGELAARRARAEAQPQP